MSELSRAAGVSISTAWRWLHGVSAPSPLAWARLRAVKIEFTPPTPTPRAKPRRKRRR